VWHVPAPHDQTFDVLADVLNYPAWWPEFKGARRIDEDSGELSLRSRLPITLHFTLTRQLEDRERGILRAMTSGDIEGTVQWNVGSLESGDTEAVFTHDIELAHSATGRIDRFIRPLLEWNHRVAMQSGAAALKRHLTP
jgi:hypothetical protein